MHAISRYLINGHRMSRFGHRAEVSCRRYNGIRPQSGFTLVELMIVVAIVGLLTAIALPNFARYRDSARTRACIANLRQLDESKQHWGLENKKTDRDIPTVDDVIVYLRANAMPQCPVNGTYRLRQIMHTPVCSFYDIGHTLSADASDDALPD